MSNLTSGTVIGLGIWPFIPPDGFSLPCFRYTKQMSLFEISLVCSHILNNSYIYDEHINYLTAQRSIGFFFLPLIEVDYLETSHVCPHHHLNGYRYPLPLVDMLIQLFFSSIVELWQVVPLYYSLLQQWHICYLIILQWEFHYLYWIYNHMTFLACIFISVVGFRGHSFNLFFPPSWCL